MAERTTDEQCRPVEVDGEVARVRGVRPMTDREREAFAEVVRAAQRKAHEDAVRRGPGAEAIRIGRGLYAQYRIHRRVEGAT